MPPHGRMCQHRAWGCAVCAGFDSRPGEPTERKEEKMEKVSVAAAIAANEEQGGTEEEKARRLAMMMHMALQDTFRNLLKWYGTMVRSAQYYKKEAREAEAQAKEGILPAVRQAKTYKRMYEGRMAEAIEALEVISRHKKLEEMEEETAQFIVLSAERMMKELEEA